MEVRELQPQEHAEALALIKDTVKSSGLSEAGRKSFLEFAESHLGSLRLLGCFDEKLIGVLGCNPDRFHLALFFVREEAQGKGAGKALFAALRREAHDADVSRITVHAAEASSGFYEALGFRQEGETIEASGIRSIPMEYLMDREYLGQEVTVIVDHPYGSLHPHYPDLELACNYGYVEELAVREGIFRNAYVCGIHEPREKVKGFVVGIIYHREDNDARWIVSPEKTYDRTEAVNAAGDTEQYFESTILWL